MFVEMSPAFLSAHKETLHCDLESNELKLLEATGGL